ncbi:MAG: 50S ribosomal protein L5 [Eubacteriales bacterium]|nr:50S ribosomal protein L5 [Eubacteriales bacterium]
MARLKEKYIKEVAPALREQLGYTNPMQVPRLLKIVVNMGINSTVESDVFKSLTKDLAQITGQAPMLRKARKSIANFKLREGMSVGACVTLRRGAMYNFLNRLVNVALPRVRDFRGVPAKAFDGAGNYSFGLNDQSVFTEVDLDKIKHTIGMNITLVTTAKTDDEARELLALLGMPFATN